MNSCHKGKAGEREAAKFLRSLGFADAARGQQHAGGKDSPDVKGIDGVHLEIKRDNKIAFGTKPYAEAIAQAERDCGGKPWALLWRVDYAPWILTTRLGDFLVNVTGEDIGPLIRHIAGHNP